MLKKTLYHLFAVCDGHGTLGHLVSYFIKQEFPSENKNYFKYLIFSCSNKNVF